MLDRTTAVGVVASEVPARRRFASEVVDLAASFYGVTADLIYGPSRVAPVAEARQLVYYVLRSRHHMALTEIARHLNRDHSTVHHGVERVKARMQVDPALVALARRFNDVPVYLEDGSLNEQAYWSAVELCDATDRLLLAVEQTAHALRRAVHESRALLRVDRLQTLVQGEESGAQLVRPTGNGNVA